MLAPMITHLICTWAHPFQIPAAEKQSLSYLLLTDTVKYPLA